MGIVKSMQEAGYPIYQADQIDPAYPAAMIRQNWPRL
jgi:hypothetical protein